jgi:Zn-dependent protease
MMLYQPKQIKISNITTSEVEIKDLIKAWIAISIAFAIVMRSLDLNFYSSFIIASLTVGIGFLLHELGHKFVAQRYGCFAEFRSFDQFLILAIIMSFFGFVFAAPGAVMISGPVGVRRNGKISVAGPLVNLALALMFLSILLIPPTGIFRIFAVYGFLINSWLALFNMIPFGNLDGAKVLRWSKPVYALVVLIAVVFMFLQSYFPLR